MFFKKPSKLSKSTLLTLLLKMKFMHATMLTLFQKKNFALEDDLVSENDAFRSHLVNHSNITNDPYLNQIFGKEDIH